MKKLWFGSVILSAAVMASPAMAQSQADFYIGAQGGYHDVGDNPLGGDDGAIFGTYVGVDVPVGETFVVGVEGNYNLGTGAIDSEYGIAGKLGFNASPTSQFFVRGGYQEVNFDLENLVGGPVPAGIDDTDGDYLVGAGAQFRVSENVSVRGVLDTIAFDSIRATAGLAFHF
ncbi:MAG: porin family protein [Sphingomonadales bacterium]|nr:porin family protein [Sphingomonadales bacterium]